MKQPIKRRDMTDKSNVRRTLDAAVIVINPERDKENGEWTGERLGATDGGVTFSAEVNYRKREFDGFNGFDVVGDKIVEGAEVKATAELAELTDASIQKIIKGDIEELDDGTKKITPRRNITPEDYIENVGIVNYLPDGTFTLIKMFNVLITSPLEINTEDNSDTVTTVELTAHIDPSANLQDLEDLPFEMYTPEVMTPVEEDGDMLTTEGGEI